MAFAAALGWAIERFAYRPLRNRARLTALITAIGVSFLLEYGYQLPSLQAQGRTFEEALRGWGLKVPGWLHAGIGFLPADFPPGPTPRFFPEPFTRVDWTVLGGVHVSNYDVVSFLVAVGFMLCLQWIVFRTRFGMAMRAVSFDSRVAGLMGDPGEPGHRRHLRSGQRPGRGGGAPGGRSRPRIDPIMGLMPGLKAFVAAVLRRDRKRAGRHAGRDRAGLAEEIVAGYTLSSFRDGIAFAILIVVLLVRPEGLLGRSTVEKV